MPGVKRHVIRRSLPYVITGLAAMGVIFYYYHDLSGRPTHARVPASATRVRVTAPVAGVAPIHDEVLPSSLTGTVAPPLSIDANGHLIRARIVRDFFDYYLSARDDVTDQALDSLVKHAITMQLGEVPAQKEAIDAWQRYGHYLDELAALPNSVASPSDTFDASALQQALDVRASVARRTLGEWYEPFFADEQQQQRFDLARLQIIRDASLPDSQKSARLAALAQQESSTQRDEDAYEKKQQEALAQISRLQESQATPDEIRAQITPSLGPEAAERVVKMQVAEGAWQAKYDGYAEQRAQIDAQNLPGPTRDVLIEQLRQRIFTEPGEALRAASFDRSP